MRSEYMDRGLDMDMEEDSKKRYTPETGTDDMMMSTQR